MGHKVLLVSVSAAGTSPELLAVVLAALIESRMALIAPWTVNAAAYLSEGNTTWDW